jgi:hypothetical protein
MASITLLGTLLQKLQPTVTMRYRHVGDAQAPVETRIVRVEAVGKNDRTGWGYVRGVDLELSRKQGVTVYRTFSEQGIVEILGVG